jgi:beta-lactamase regulating signal transducer with metallopeptidase domain
MSFSTTQGSVAATPTSVNPAAAAPTNSASPNKTESITIVLSIIGAFLTLVSVIVAVLQYRIQAQRRLDVERDGQQIEMNPQRPAQEAEGTVAAPPL